MELFSMDLYLSGLHFFTNPVIYLSSFLGVLIGIVFGALPGLTATMTIAVFIPFTFGLSPVIAFAFLLGLYSGSVYGGSISAILINIPGTPSAIATSLDGYPLSQMGRAGEAIGISTISSTLGGFFSVIVLMFAAPAIASVALKFSAEEYVGITLIGLSIIAIISPGSTVKGLMSGVIGLIIGIVGMDPITGYPRFIMGRAELLEGIDSIPVMIGMYGLSEMLVQISSSEYKVTVKQKLSRLLPPIKHIKQIFGTVVRSSFIGVLIGALPAAGGSIAALVAYGQEKRFGKRKELLGTGIIEGVAAPEAANNASTGGALIPMLTLGIPGDAMTAVLMGGLIIQGLRPGPLLFQQQMPFVSSIFISLLLSVVFMCILGLLGAPVFAKLISFPKKYLIPAILVFGLVGSYAISNSIFDIWVLIISGIVGFVFRKIGLPIAPIILGMILGPLFESNFRRALMLSGGNWATFVQRPISLAFLIVVVVVLTGPAIMKKFNKTLIRGN
ncbi:MULTISPECIES: tripartite tricarboxylate transporter permease [unclassified Sphaerochaeta]|jgi:putative tricarboxylic transport membrane protein|uniref:tripartite tricarboxylate transporter permease n=1 Tax=unclassified Sphaerochaeta TaxID=2637943 RepID=UPI0025E76D06|nr:MULTISPECIES: tripartite tricarboxylate transporter permease [unclassified Sphaerochaeta]MDX9825045.1 tripartite tricarboxylate transporter permease [Sphaerochaeta sp.]